MKVNGKHHVVLVVWALLLLWVGCWFLDVPPEEHLAEPPASEVETENTELEKQELRAAVLYAPGRSEGWRDRLDALENTTLANVEVQGLEIGATLDGWDMVVADPSLLESEGWDECRRTLTRYVREGGYLVLDNCFDTAFSKEFLGIRSIWPVGAPPTGLTTPEGPEDLEGLQGLLRDFAAIYPEYYNAAQLAGLDYGDGFEPGTCTVLAQQDGLAVYTLNYVGEGGVFLTNPMLPNLFSVNSAAMAESDGNQAAFAGSTAGANRLFYGKILSYVSMERYGYALERVYGTYGTNPFSWELHYEDITAVDNGACYQFAELCEDAWQIPSFSLVRNFYWWFLRAESVTYLTNLEAEGMRYEMDEVENIYSSGTHVVADDEWLSQVWVEDTDSYFSDAGGYDQRAYICLRDLNGDDQLDILAGSSDGQFYFYAGEENPERFTTKKAVLLKGPDGEPLAVPGGYSAPTLLDVDGDGEDDLVTGAANGLVFWARGLGNMEFGALEILLDPCLGAGQIFPEAGDMDGDGVEDIVVGSAGGGLAIYYGDGDGNFDRRETVELNWELMRWAAPCPADLNGDGRLDIALGTFHGYVARLIWDEATKTYVYRGYLDGTERNYKGNTHLKFGNNCKPAFGDVNGDGRVDLVCGQLEYGLAYPIDSPYFPSRKALQQQIDWMKKNNYYVSTHTITHWFASREYESREFARTWDALAGYGLDLNRTGTNQHTWHTSSQDTAQTYSVQYEQGYLWNSGSELPGSSATPQIAAENVLFLPFFLREGDAQTMLICNVSTMGTVKRSWANISTRYDVPMLMYYHCDMIYKDDTKARRAVEEVTRFLRESEYMCVREDQLAYASAAALNTDITAWTDEDGALHLSAAPISTQIAMYDENYQRTVGIKLTLAPGSDPADFTTDATVWRQDGNSLYLSLDKEVTLRREKDSGEAHLRRVNLPANISQTEDGLVVDFVEDGLMQAEVTGRATTDSEGWTVIPHWRTTEFRKMGNASQLVITLP